MRRANRDTPGQASGSGAVTDGGRFVPNDTLLDTKITG